MAVILVTRPRHPAIIQHARASFLVVKVSHSRRLKTLLSDAQAELFFGARARAVAGRLRRAVLRCSSVGHRMRLPV